MVEVQASRVGETGFKIETRARDHAFNADSEKKDGGTDTAPTPHELLAGSLAACTSMTVQMYAARKGWPLKSCDVTVRMTDGDGKDPNSATHFDVTVSFNGDLDSEQRQRLLEIANRCPVHRALARPVHIQVVAV